MMAVQSLDIIWNNGYCCSCWRKLTFLFTIYSLLASINASQVVNYGSVIRLQCNPANDSAEVKWLKNNVTIDFKGFENHLLIRRNGRLLKIKDAVPSDAGVYSCFDITNGLPGRELIAYKVSLTNGKVVFKLESNHCYNCRGGGGGGGCLVGGRFYPLCRADWNCIFIYLFVYLFNFY